MCSTNIAYHALFLIYRCNNSMHLKTEAHEEINMPDVKANPEYIQTNKDYIRNVPIHFILNCVNSPMFASHPSLDGLRVGLDNDTDVPLISALTIPIW